MTRRWALLAAGMLAPAVLAGTASRATAQPRDSDAKLAVARPLETPNGRKPRVVITTDPELDDSNSLVRYLLFSSDFDTVGLIYASSQFHWKGDGKGTKAFVAGREYTRFGLNLCPCTSWRWDPNERFIDDAVELYAQAYPNLRVHDRDYPTPEALKSRIRWGNVEFDGEMSRDTPGSDLIKSLLLDDDESPVYLHAWGGQSTIARALKSIEEQYESTPQWPAIRAKVIRKAVIHPSGDQDDTYGKYIRPHWPEIRYRRLAGGVRLGYGTQSAVSVEDAVYFTAEWTRRNISTRGPLGAFYRVWGDGKQKVKGDVFDYFGLSSEGAEELKKRGYIVWSPIQPTGSFLGEGDTPTFLNLIDNGLRGYRDDGFGGWGGYAGVDAGPAFGAAFAPLESVAANPGARREIPRAPTHPFLAAAQRDFAARFVWATTSSYAQANHPPRLSVRSRSRFVSARPGEVVSLAVAPSDPDGNAVALRWWRWDDADSYSGAVSLEPASGTRTSVTVPADAAAGQTIHVIAEATDDGAPALTRYERFVVTVNRP
jgi:cellulose-binding protein